MVLGRSSRSPIRVQPFFGYRSASMLHLTARALRQPEPLFEKRGFWRSLSTMIGQYASREVAGLSVQLEFESSAGESIRAAAVSDEEGFVRFEIPFAQSSDLPRRTDWERASLVWQSDQDCTGISKTAFILAPGETARTGVISDIDDTILETGITGSARAILRNWKRVLAQMPGERIVVPGAPEFFAALGGGTGRKASDRGPLRAPIPQPMARPVFYVSSSPWNLFSYLVTFKHQRDLPLGPITLRDWGFNRETLGSDGHGSHKLGAAEHLLATYPDMKFVLVGDDTQKDLSVFGGLANARPERIAAVFIRQTASRPLSETEKSIKAELSRSTVPFWTGSDYAAARSFLEEIGLDVAAQDSAAEILARDKGI
uniref:phosphatase domain-containing protein n=1 Tax=uncultured Erythrobacter sp. TaxID=263913 RepID=UPI00263193AF|nr:phosphatase domain-containing protein [uncultured Erythrobacter sp.]